MKSPLTLETLPQAFSQLTETVNNIQRIVLEKSSIPQPESDRWFSLKELIDYLPGHPVEDTVRRWIHLRTIPHYTMGKRVVFLKSEIDIWIKGKKRKTATEILLEAEQFISLKKKKKI